MDFSERGQDPAKKLAGIVVVVLVHALVIYALLNGLGTQIVKVIKELPIETKLIEEVKPPPPPEAPPPPPPPPKLAAPPPPFIPPPEVQVQVQPPPASNTIQAVSNVPPPVQPEIQAQSTGSATMKAVVDFSTCEKPEYPRNSLRNEEQGTVRIQFLIGLDGHVADSRIEKTSGSRTLDAAAKNALSLCKFKPGTIDGKVQQSWTAVDYVWKLPD